MSLINQVLNRLEQRGAHPVGEQTLIRAVPEQAERNWIKLALLAFSMAAVAGGLWLGMQMWPPSVEQVRQPVDVIALPASAVPGVASSGVPEAEPLLPASKLSFELSMVPVAEPLPEEKVAKPAQPAPERHAAVRPPKSSPAVSKPAEIAPPPVTAAVPIAEPPIKLVSRSQQADAEYRKALLLQRQGHAAEALAGYEAALKLNAQHDAARLALAALLMEGKRSTDAERVLQEGLQQKPTHIVFSMALARVQVESGQIDQALDTLQKNLPRADDKADYQAFYAALLQRQGRHKEAVAHYQVAVQLAPNSGVWLMGYGLSLQAVQRIDDAKAAYLQALATRTLSPELTAFVQQKLNGF